MIYEITMASNQTKKINAYNKGIPKTAVSASKIYTTGILSTTNNAKARITNFCS
jgi:hypothetical protein